MIMKFVMLLVLVAGFAGYSLAGSIFSRQEDGHVGPAPRNYEAHPNGFWFGSQDLLCIMGIEAEDIVGLLPDFISSRISDRSKRHTSPRRTTLNPNHRMVFYHGHVYEWGTGHNGYHYGREVVTRDCPVTWERAAAGYSNCPAHVAREFINSYRGKFGAYNLLTNNCHHFSNRLSALLSSDTCEAPRNRWADVARDAWRQISRGSFSIKDLFKRGQDSEEEIPEID